ncbi:6132_t:CDS:2, partial [Gigaspora margarita]
SPKNKITNDEIPNVNLPDNVYKTYCQYFTDRPLIPPIYNLYKYFCNQSNKFHTLLRNINEELKKNNGYKDNYIFSAAYKYVKKNKKRLDAEKRSTRESTRTRRSFETLKENFDGNNQDLILSEDALINCQASDQTSTVVPLANNRKQPLRTVINHEQLPETEIYTS